MIVILCIYISTRINKQLTYLIIKERERGGGREGERERERERERMREREEG